MAAIVSAVALLSGCTGNGEPAATGLSAATPVATTPNDEVAATAMLDSRDTGTANLDLAYIIGPTAARQIEYRIDWQSPVYPDQNSGLKNIWVQGDSVFALDGRNFLTRIDRNNGQRIWRSFVAQPLDDVFGVIHIASMDRVYVMTESYLIVLNGSDGSQTGKQTLGQFSSTAPIVYGSNVIYGARNGQVVWHSYLVGYQWRAYQVSTAMRLAPVPAGAYFIAASTDGRVMVLRGESAVSIWSRQLLDGIVAPPVTGNGAVYIAGLDQHLRAYEVASGRSLWHYLTESKLTQPPTLMGDYVYQQIPTEGLVCFEAWPRDTIRGKVVWKAAVKGNVVNSYRNQLMVWDQDTHRLTMVHPDRGAVVDQVSLPAVDLMRFSSRRNGEIFAASNDGRVTHLVPR